MFAALTRRRTFRRRFSAREVPAELLAALSVAAAGEGTKLSIVEGRERREALATVVGEADRIQMDDPAFRRELAAWLRPNGSRSRDGMPGYSQEMGAIMSLAAPLAIRTFDMGKGRAARDRDLTLGSPVLAVLTTPGDEPADWLAAGQGLERLWLRGLEEGVHLSFLNQPVEVPVLRPKVAEITGQAGFPQLVLRMGYGRATRATPRRPVEQVLT
jgi:hypothetical protein